MEGLSPAPAPLKAAAPRTGPGLRLVLPGGGYVSSNESFSTWLGTPGARLTDLGTLAAGEAGHRLLALRYAIANGAEWNARFAWRPSLEAALRRAACGTEAVDEAIARVEALLRRADAARVSARAVDERTLDAMLGALPGWLERVADPPDDLLVFLVVIETSPERALQARAWLRALASRREPPALLDLAYLAIHPLHAYPATTVRRGALRYLVVMDKGEMGARAVREAVALGLVPVVCHSLQDDAEALQVRLARKHKGLTVGLVGNFRESYANYVQIADKVKEAFRVAFGARWEQELALAGVYPGYGPLAENAAAIRHFRREGLVFVGPMQDVVENAGDKRKFRRMAHALDPTAVTPGIIIDADDEATIDQAIRDGHASGQFAFPGRLKAANGGGGRGQVVIRSPDEVPAAIQKVLGDIRANGWDAGVMFEQNIPETTHLEVQVLRDRYGNTRHFGMRDCTEQRASQKIQEEAPPALLAALPHVEEAITAAAVGIADAAGYVGAGTVELMWKDGKFYFLEMNTRIQVEHPVTEECHAVRRGTRLEPLNLVQWQVRIANGEAIDFAQADVVRTHVAREFRINAESWNPDLRDSRDGGRGLFVPNAGVFDEIRLPDRKAVLQGLKGADDVRIRFDCGFEEGDVLVNKDPTFGKLIVSVKADARPYEVLRQASLRVLQKMRIQGRQVMPDGTVLADHAFLTNIPDHVRILKSALFRRHCDGDETGRHVNWVVAELRSAAATGRA